MIGKQLPDTVETISKNLKRAVLRGTARRRSTRCQVLTLGIEGPAPDKVTDLRALFDLVEAERATTVT